jgi:hypothetical protein
MYSQKTITRNMDEFAAREGWLPRYHSYEEIKEFSARLNSLIDMESNSKSSYISLKAGARLTARQQREIARWIENEQVRVRNG